MSERIFVATRKGLFDYRRSKAGWRVERVSFLGDSVTLALSDARDGHVYAALNHGHFGVKLHRSEDGGARFEETRTPAFPAKPTDSDDPTPWSVQQIWSLETGGPDEPGVLWAGTIPGALYRSRDRGEAWELVESLWQRDDRMEWSGGGYDYPGIHSICVDPRDSRCVSVGISIGGVWMTADGGNSWAARSDGMS